MESPVKGLCVLGNLHHASVQSPHLSNRKNHTVYGRYADCSPGIWVLPYNLCPLHLGRVMW